MRKFAVIFAAVICMFVMVQYSSSRPVNPKKAVCEQGCVEAKKKCFADAKKDKAKKAACTAAFDECMQKCAKDQPKKDK